MKPEIEAKFHKSQYPGVLDSGTKGLVGNTEFGEGIAVCMERKM